MGCKAVDLDGTLAFYDGFKGPEHIGPPIQAMVDRIRLWLEAGETVKIFTARAENPDHIPFIEKWLEEEAGLPVLEITNKKTYDMEEFWDDRAIQVLRNTGVPLQNLLGTLKI